MFTVTTLHDAVFFTREREAGRLLTDNYHRYYLFHQGAKRSQNVKKCPSCAEEIQDQAIKCRHHGGELSDTPSSVRTASARPEQEHTVYQSGRHRVAFLGPATWLWASFLFALALPCSAVLDAQERLEMKSEPAIGESGERGQGDVMYAEFDVVVEAQARVLSDVVVDRDFTIVRGTSLKPETEAGRVRYCTVDEKKRLLGIASPRRVCLYSEQKPMSFTNIFTQTIGAMRSHRNSLAMPVDFEMVDVSKGRDKSTVRKEVLFSGAAGGVLRLRYREFLDDLARPAFTEELTYDIIDNQPITVSVKGARFEINRAGNDGVRYRIVEPFRRTAGF